MGQTRSVAGKDIINRSPCVWDLTVPWVEMYWSIDLLKRYRQAGYTFASLTIQDMPPSFDGVLRDIERFVRLCEPHSDWLAIARNGVDIEAGRAAGKLVIGFNVQDTELVHSDLRRLRVLKSMGVRHMLLAYQLRNNAADGCAEPADAGLSLFGRRLVREMNNLGMVVDCSHTGRQSTLDAMEVSAAPVIFSHSGVKAQCEHIRNIDDEQIKACAATHGCIGVVGIGAFLGDPTASAETVFRHVDHIVQLVGPEYAGIGTDYIDNLEPIWPSMIASKDSMWRDPTGTQLYEGVAFRPEQLSELAELMSKAGYSESAIYGVLGTNFERVYKAVEAHASALSHAADGQDKQSK
ncbi:MAG: membrane dipeptidase [Pseudomonadota bacterium]